MNTRELITHFEGLAEQYREAVEAYGLSVSCEFHYTTEKLQQKEERGKDTPYFDAELRFTLPNATPKGACVYPLGVFCEIDAEGVLTEEVEEELRLIDEQIETLLRRLDGKEDVAAEFLLATKERDDAAKAQYRAIMREAFPPLKTALSVIVPLLIIFGIYFLIRMIG